MQRSANGAKPSFSGWTLFGTKTEEVRASISLTRRAALK